MAKSPMPGGATRTIVTPPNETGTGGNRAKNGYLPLAGATGSVLPINHGGGDRRHGAAPARRYGKPCETARIIGSTSAHAKMPQPPSAIEPGKGAIPVNPWNATGEPNRAIAEPDAGRPPRR